MKLCRMVTKCEMLNKNNNVKSLFISECKNTEEQQKMIVIKGRQLEIFSFKDI